MIDPLRITALALIAIMGLNFIILQPIHDCSNGSTNCKDQVLWVPFWQAPNTTK